MEIIQSSLSLKLELFTFSPIVFTLRLALMLSPNWFPRFMLGPIVGLLACTFLKKGIVRLRAVKFFLHFFMLNIALCSNIFCRFGTSFVVTAYFTSKATFVQMFKCFHPAGSNVQMFISPKEKIRAFQFLKFSSGG